MFVVISIVSIASIFMTSQWNILIILIISSDLKPGTWYSLQLTAHNGAGSRVVTTQFATLSVTGDLNDDPDDSHCKAPQDKLCCHGLGAHLELDLTRWVIIIIIVIVTISFIKSSCNQVDGSIALPIISAIIVTSTLLLVGVYVFRKRR